MESSTDQLRAFALSVLFHLGLLGLAWLAAHLSLRAKDSQAAGEPIQASLQATQADLTRVRAMIAAAQKDAPTPPKPKPVKPAPPQPIPEPNPQTSDTPLQMKPQAPQDRPDREDQQKVTQVADLKAEQLREQEEKRRQEQVNLTLDLERQQVAERRQRLREQQAKIEQELEAARKQRKLEEQKLQQLADLRNAAAVPAPARAAPAAPAGEKGPDDDLRARYRAAMLQTAEQNWNHIGAPERSRCVVRFSQIPGGVITRVEFISCPYDDQGREFVDRALRKQPMPYQGFDKVFMPKVELTFCYPKEECTP